MAILILSRSPAGGGGGSFVDGSNYAFTSPAAVSAHSGLVKTFLGGLNGYLDSGTSGTDANPPPSGWSGPDQPSSGAGPGSYYPRYDNAQILTRSKCLGFDSAYHDGSNPSNGAAFGYGFDYGNDAGYAESYNHGYVYYGCRAGQTTMQWKIVKEKPTASIVDGAPQVNYSHWINGGGLSQDQFTITDSASQGTASGAVTSQSGTISGSGVFFDNQMDNLPGFTTGSVSGQDQQWYRWEYWHRVSTGLASNDGAVRLRVWRVSDGALMVDNTYSSLDDFDSASRYRWFLMQNYFGNSNLDPPTSGNGFAFWDDVTVHLGSGARECIYLGDASTYAACNKGKMLYQPVVTWSGTSCTVKANKPSSFSANTWLYMIDSAGTVVNSSGIAV